MAANVWWMINFHTHHEDQTARLMQQNSRLINRPVVKAMAPLKYGPKANDLAIKVLGGAGLHTEYPVEQWLRDNRLNPIHEREQMASKPWILLTT